MTRLEGKGGSNKHLVCFSESGSGCEGITGEPSMGKIYGIQIWGVQMAHTQATGW
jgi:hypothetical protein